MRTYPTNNTLLEKAIASIKSVQVQLQQQCTSAAQQEASMALTNNPKLNVNARDECSFSPLLCLAAEKENVEVLKQVIGNRAVSAWPSSLPVWFIVPEYWC